MQNITKGLIVRSICGHDKNELYLVLDCTDTEALLVNGKNRPTAKPKKKSTKHLVRVSSSAYLSDNEKIDNSRIIKILKDYKKGE